MGRAKKLTARSIEQAKPRRNKGGDLVRTEFPDAGKPGLYLVIQPNGKKSWAVRYRRRSDGKPRKYTLDGFPSLATAHKLAQAVLDRIAEGEDPAGEKKVAKLAARMGGDDAERNRFENVAVSFIERHAKRHTRASSWRETARLLGLRPDPEKDDWRKAPLIRIPDSEGPAVRWAGRPVQEITKRDVLDLLDGIVDRGAGITANRMLAAVRKLFNWAIERDIIEASPCATVKAPAPIKSRDRILSDDELRWFWKACGGSGVPFGPLAKLLLLKGQRLNEVGGMRTRELDIDARTWTIPAERAKNNEPHVVPLTDAALAIINDMPRIKSKAGYLFTLNGETPVSGFSRAKARLDRLMLEQARKEAEERGADPAKVEIQHWTMHDLRRTCASGMARLGIALPVIEKVLNHRSGTFRGVVRTYQHHEFALEKREALQTWARYVGLAADASLMAKHKARLTLGDEEAQKRAWAAFLGAIAEGGERWERYLRPAENVVPFEAAV